MHEKRDQDLVHQWLQGNEHAYRILFNRYVNKLQVYANGYVNDWFVSEQLVMDVWLNIWQKKHLLNSQLSFSAYVFRSVKNKTLDHLRKKKRRLLSMEESDMELHSPFHADHAIRQQESDALYNWRLAGLSAKRKQVFMMSREGGYTYQQIANNLQLSKNTVENHMVAAIRLMRSRIFAPLTVTKT